MTSPVSGYQKRKESRQISYTALLRYLQRYCGYRGRPKAYQQLLKDAGVHLVKRKSNARYYNALEQTSVRRVLELFYQRAGSKVIKRRSK